MCQVDAVECGHPRRLGRSRWGEASPSSEECGLARPLVVATGSKTCRRGRYEAGGNSPPAPGLVPFPCICPCYSFLLLCSRPVTELHLCESLIQIQLLQGDFPYHGCPTLILFPPPTFLRDWKMVNLHTFSGHLFSRHCVL